jgi:hypothetical protein
MLHVNEGASNDNLLSNDEGVDFDDALHSGHGSIRSSVLWSDQLIHELS